MQLIGLRISNLLISKAQSYSTCIGWALKMGIRKLFHGVGVCAFFPLKKCLLLPVLKNLHQSVYSFQPEVLIVPKAKLNIRYFTAFYKMAVKSHYRQTQLFDLTAQNS